VNPHACLCLRDTQRLGRGSMDGGRSLEPYPLNDPIHRSLFVT
jgi:hypothetical protein